MASYHFGYLALAFTGLTGGVYLMNAELTAIEKQLLQAFRCAEPIYQSVALEVLQMHPAQQHKPRIEHAGGNVVKISWGEEHNGT